jgi:hypothetical protein
MTRAARPAGRPLHGPPDRGRCPPYSYVDDYILAAVESPDGSTLNRVGRTALHTIHGLFPPPAQSGHVGAKTPFPLKIRSRRRPMGAYERAPGFCVRWPSANGTSHAAQSARSYRRHHPAPEEKAGGHSKIPISGRKNATCSDNSPLSSSTVYPVKSGAQNDAPYNFSERHW